MNGRIVIDGLGYKLGGRKHGRWQARWMVLQDDAMWYFQGAQDVVPKVGLFVCVSE